MLRRLVALGVLAAVPGGAGAAPADDEVLLSALTGAGVSWRVLGGDVVELRVEETASVSTLRLLAREGGAVRCAYGGSGLSQPQRTGPLQLDPSTGAARVALRRTGRTVRSHPACAALPAGSARPLAPGLLAPPDAWTTVAAGAAPPSVDLRVWLQGRGAAPAFSGGLRARLEDVGRLQARSYQLRCRVSWLTSATLTASVRLGPRAASVTVPLRRVVGDARALLVPQASHCELERQSYGTEAVVPLFAPFAPPG